MCIDENTIMLENMKKLGIDCPGDLFYAWSLSAKVSVPEMEKFNSLLSRLAEWKDTCAIETLRKLSRMPSKIVKTFENFDFTRLSGQNVESLRNLETLNFLHASKNVIFIGDTGVGKTHLSLALGLECCKKRRKVYFS